MSETSRNYDPYPRFYNLGYEPIIGKNCSLVNTLFDCADQITIEDNVFFGHDCQVLTSEHIYTKFGEDRMKESAMAPVIIQTGAWIASGAIILQGVIVGKHSVVAAGSVVKNHVPPYTVVGGVPAKVIKEISH